MVRGTPEERSGREDTGVVEGLSSHLGRSIVVPVPYMFLILLSSSLLSPFLLLTSLSSRIRFVSFSASVNGIPKTPVTNPGSTGER